MKAQISQIFIYVTTIIIVAFILLYGYRAIFVFKEKSEQVSFIQFKNDIENTIETLSLDFGSVKVKEFILPENTNVVCFVKNYPSIPLLADTNYPIIEDSINSGVKKNVFLISDDVEESFYVDKISTAQDLLCVRSQANKIKLRMEGVGDHTFISED